MPIGGQFSIHGVPDIIGCLNGKFIGIECKANKGKPTALQLKHLNDIKETGGVAILVDETGIGTLKRVLEFTPTGFFDLTNQGADVEKEQKATKQRSRKNPSDVLRTEAGDKTI